LTEEEYQERATVGAEELDEDAVAEIDDFVAMSRALGLVRGEVDLVGAASDLQASGTLAYYDPALERVTVRGTELTPSVRATLVHELTHVLQDQHFDLSRIGDPDFERAGPLRAIVEGDAGRIEDAYVAEELSAEERAEHQRQ